MYVVYTYWKCTSNNILLFIDFPTTRLRFLKIYTYSHLFHLKNIDNTLQWTLLFSNCIFPHLYIFVVMSVVVVFSGRILVTLLLSFCRLHFRVQFLRYVSAYSRIVFTRSLSISFSLFDTCHKMLYWWLYISIWTHQQKYCILWLVFKWHKQTMPLSSVDLCIINNMQ